MGCHQEAQDAMSGQALSGSLLSHEGPISLAELSVQHGEPILPKGHFLHQALDCADQNVGIKL